LPNPDISRPTSAALLVRYLRQIPVDGWYVLSVSVAMVGTEGVWVGADSSVFVDVDFLDVLVGGRWEG
jgi:hypothetical protein